MDRVPSSPLLDTSPNRLANDPSSAAWVYQKRMTAKFVAKIRKMGPRLLRAGKAPTDCAFASLDHMVVLFRLLLFRDMQCKGYEKTPTVRLFFICFLVFTVRIVRNLFNTNAFTHTKYIPTEGLRYILCLFVLLPGINKYKHK